MPNRQVVIISGKTCTGKTGLAKLLHTRYEFKVISTRDILLEHLGLKNAHATRGQLITAGRRAGSAKAKLL